MFNEYILVEQSLNLNGQIKLVGAKNAALPIIASLILTEGESILTNVPNSQDIREMVKLLNNLGAKVDFCPDKNILKVDSSTINKFEVNQEIMNKMRASILVMGPLLARFGKAKVAMPGGCLIGSRPIDYHLKGFKKMGVEVEENGSFLNAFTKDNSLDNKVIFEYPSVGATENIAMFATLKEGETTIINAALEPEVLDFLDILKEMGAKIEFCPPATLKITGVNKLNSVTHSIIPDRLEAGAVLLAAAITGGQVELPEARIDHMDLFVEKLQEMGHKVEFLSKIKGIKFTATQDPIAVSFKTGPFPGFPTDLQAPMMAAQCIAQGTSFVEETVFENRLLHVYELQKMGANIKLNGPNKVIIDGVKELKGMPVVATDIRASCALVLAGLVANGFTQISGINHWRRGYDNLENKLFNMGAKISINKTI